MGRRMILMHEDWHRDTLDNAIAEYVRPPAPLHRATPLRSARLGAARRDGVSRTKPLAAILHPDLPCRQIGRACWIGRTGGIIPATLPRTPPRALASPPRRQAIRHYLPLGTRGRLCSGVTWHPPANARSSMSELSEARNTRALWQNRPLARTYARRDGFRFAYSFDRPLVKGTEGKGYRERLGAPGRA